MDITKKRLLYNRLSHRSTFIVGAWIEIDDPLVPESIRKLCGQHKRVVPRLGKTTLWMESRT
eukprot:8277577-Heterocapsa_arctica.AAC.1